MKLRFSIRTLLASMVVVGVTTVVGVKWWTTPYTVLDNLEGESVKFQLRRELNGNLVHVGTVQFIGYDFYYGGEPYRCFIGKNGIATPEGRLLVQEAMKRLAHENRPRCFD